MRSNTISDKNKIIFLELWTESSQNQKMSKRPEKGALNFSRQMSKNQQKYT